MIRLTQEQKAVMRASVGAALIHLLVFLLLSLYTLFSFSGKTTESLTREKPIEVVFLPPPPVEKPPVRAIDVPDHAPDTEPVENAPYESHRNTRAASEEAASGDRLLPSQRGKERDFVNLETKNYAPDQHQNTPDTSLQKKSESLSQPRPTPIPTPKPKEELALLKPQPPPRSEGIPTPEETRKMPEQINTAEHSKKPPSQKSQYQPFAEATRIRGSIDNRGRSSVDAIATPLGKYRHNLSNAIGARWNYYIRQRMDLIRVGKARIQFFINENGKIENLRVIQNNSNEVFATCSVQAIMEADILPIPPEIASTLPNRKLEVEYTFSVY